MHPCHCILDYLCFRQLMFVLCAHFLLLWVCIKITLDKKSNTAICFIYIDRHWRQIILTLIADDINLVIIFNWLVIHNIFDVCSWWCCWWRRRALGLFVCNIDKDKLMTIDFSRILLSIMLHDKRILKVTIPSQVYYIWNQVNLISLDKIQPILPAIGMDTAWNLKVEIIQERDIWWQKTKYRGSGLMEHFNIVFKWQK